MDALVIVPQPGFEVPEAQPLPLGGQDLLDALRRDFLAGACESYEIVAARQRHGAQAARMAAKKARKAAIEAQAERQAHERRRGR